MQLGLAVTKKLEKPCNVPQLLLGQRVAIIIIKQLYHSLSSYMLDIPSYTLLLYMLSAHIRLKLVV